VTADKRAAKAICANCPVRTLCRAYALGSGELYGIWGGTTERERQSAATQRRPAPARTQAHTPATVSAPAPARRVTEAAAQEAA
jgi:hypothetical protein